MLAKARLRLDCGSVSFAPFLSSDELGRTSEKRAVWNVCQYRKKGLLLSDPFPTRPFIPLDQSHDMSASMNFA